MKKPTARETPVLSSKTKLTRTFQGVSNDLLKLSLQLKRKYEPTPKPLPLP
jgi:hypothetical protein